MEENMLEMALCGQRHNVLGQYIDRHMMVSDDDSSFRSL